MKILIGGVHRSGTNYLAYVLGQAVKGYKVIAEDFDTIAKGIDVVKYQRAEGKALEDLLSEYAEHVNTFIESQPDNFIQVSPQYTLTLGSKEIKADKKVFLIRNPFDHALSKCNLNPVWTNRKLDLLIKDVETYYNHISKYKRIKKFRYEDLRDGGIENLIDYLGLEADLSKVDLNKKVNASRKKFKSLEHAISDKRKLSKLIETCEKFAELNKY